MNFSELYNRLVCESTGDMRIKYIGDASQNKLDKAIEPYVYSIKDSTKKTTTLVVRGAGSDRKSIKADLEKKLKNAGIDFKAVRAGGSTGATDIMFDKHKVRIIYKPVSGGMNETTLNSTITELAPALAFMNGKKSFKSVDDFYSFLQNAKSNGVYVGSDEKAGKAFIDSMPGSSKYEEKMENAMAILDYLWEEDKKSPIDQVYWGYRAKPAGVDSSHKGDLFIKYKNGEMLGVSLKAGGEKTAEPQLNTYVNKFFDDIGYLDQKESLKDLVYNKIHGTIGLDKDWKSRSKKSDSIDIIEDLKVSDPEGYEAKYNEMLALVRDAVIKAANHSVDGTIAYIKKQVIKQQEDVPLVVVKAFGKKYKFVSDEDDLALFLPKVVSITSYPSKTSKQNWFIDLNAKGEKLTMLMSLRSNQVSPNNKIAQDFNLALKFNGIK